MIVSPEQERQQQSLGGCRRSRHLIGGLSIHPKLYSFIQSDILQPSTLEGGNGSSTLRFPSPSEFWGGLQDCIEALGGENEALLAKRACLEAKLNSWCDHQRKKWRQNAVEGTQSSPLNIQGYKQYLYHINYLINDADEPPFSIDTKNLDAEIQEIAGPQLVVPLSNARFALNAANARWGSLFDAFYGSDVIPKKTPFELKDTVTRGYNPRRGAEVIRRAVSFLDEMCPLTHGSYGNITGARLECSTNNTQLRLIFELGSNNPVAQLQDVSMFVGYSGGIEPGLHEPSRTRYSLLFRHHRLGIELLFDPSDERAREEHPAAMADVILEAAVSTIQDCEDSVSVVDADDKIALYQNWLGLMRGDLTSVVPKSGGTTIRKLAPDRVFKSSTGTGTVTCSGRSLLLIRHVGHHMYTDLVSDSQGRPIPETFLDAFVTGLIGLYDLRDDEKPKKMQNSRTGSLYVVKPKLHGPEEVRLAMALLDRVEDTLQLPRYTIKCGIMDEERRTTLNLRACIREARHRVFFINTGFLDRTADEIHSSFKLGPFDIKERLKTANWIRAYEEQNVAIGLECGFTGNGQIGKGIRASPDSMAEMLLRKGAHPKAGANTAWVPSPTAATLHAIHYHQYNVIDVQRALMAAINPESRAGRQETVGESPYLDALLEIPILYDPFTELTQEQIQKELENNIQSILGYVVRWVDQGIGCSKVPDIYGNNLMEDRATLRISSQHVANWLYHRVVTEAQVFDTFRQMASVVDQQNSADALYLPMTSRPISSLPFQAALDLVFKGANQPNGYTESILNCHRLHAKRILYEQRQKQQSIGNDDDNLQLSSSIAAENRYEDDTTKTTAKL